MRSLPIFAGVLEQSLEKLIDLADRHVFYKRSVFPPKSLPPGTLVILIQGSVVLTKPGILGMVAELESGSFLGLTEASVGDSLIWDIQVRVLSSPTVLYTVQYNVGVINPATCEYIQQIQSFQ